MKIRVALQIFFLLASSLLFCNPTHAVPMPRLNVLTLDVADNSVETRTQLLPQAFAQVALRISSSKAVLQHADFIQAQQQVEKYLDGFAYQELRNEESSTPRYNLTLQFNEKMLEQLFSKMGRSALSHNRPSTLFWLVIENDEYSQFVERSTYKDVVSSLETLGQNYGIPTLMPLLDLPERLFVNESDVLTFNEQTLQQAAGRYNADMVVAGKLKQVDGIWQCEWRLLGGMQSTTWQSASADLNNELESMFNQLAEKLIVRYGRDFKSKMARKSISLRVNGVDNAVEYARVLEYLKKLTPIKQVEVSSVSGSEAVFLLTADGGKDAITKALNMDTTLVLEFNNLAQQTENSDQLLYRVGL